MVIWSLFTLVVVRLLGPSDFGAYTYWLSGLALTFTIVDFGVTTFLQRKWSREGGASGEDLSLAIGLRLILAGILLFLASGYVLAVGERRLMAGLLAFMAVLAEGIRDLTGVHFTATQQFRVRTTIRLAERVLAAILGWVSLLVGWGLTGLFVTQLVSRVAATAMQIRLGTPLRRVRFQRAEAIQLMKRGMPFLLISALYVGYLRGDVILVRWMAGLEPAGFYGAAYTLINLANLAIAAIGIGLFPVLARAGEEDENRLRSLTKTVGEIYLVCMLPFAAFVTLYGNELVTMLFSARYRPSVAPLRTLIWAQLFTAASNPLATFLYLRNQERRIAALLLALLLANVGLNVILIPRLGIQGAAFATLLTEAANYAWLSRRVAIKAGWSFRVRVAAAVGGASGVAAIAGRVHWMVGGLAFILCFVSASLAMGVVRMAEWKALWRGPMKGGA